MLKRFRSSNIRSRNLPPIWWESIKPLKIKWPDRPLAVGDVANICDAAKIYAKESDYEQASECLQLAMLTILVLRREAAAKPKPESNPYFPE